MKKLILSGSVASMLAIFFAACGDDVTNVHNDGYAIVESLDSASCNNDNEGEMTLVKPTSVLYVCNDGEWSVVNASEAVDLRCKSEPLKDSTGYKIICDGKTIGTVQNGTDGENGQKGADGKNGKNGKNGADGKNGQKGDAGKDAKEVNVDSLSKVISKKVTGEVVDSLACRVDSSWTDTKESLINVQIACGSGMSVIQLPTLVPNKNLTKHYKKTVMLRFTYSSGAQLSELGFSTTAELTVMEVDSNFERTGKNFVSEMQLSKKKELTIYDEPSMGISKMSVHFLEGQIDVTNMMNSYAQFRVSLARGSGFSDMVFMAFVDMDAGDTIVIDFISDYKAARIETLMKNGETNFASASKQANDEITEALGLGKDLAAVDFHMSDSVEHNEKYVATAWPMLLMNYERYYSYVFDYNRVYFDYRELFGKEGNFKKAIEEPLPFSSTSMAEYPVFFVDFFLMKGENDGAEYKINQKGLIDAYELPACDSKRNGIYETTVTGGFFKYFRCKGRMELWEPLRNFGRSEEEVNEIVSALAGKCNDSTSGQYFMMDSLGESIVMECNGQSWARSYDLKKALCKGEQVGSYVSGIGGKGYVQYFRCVADSSGNISADSVAYEEYAIGKQCNAGTKDTLYSAPGHVFFYRCDTLGKSFVPLYRNYIDTLASMQLGKCDKANGNNVNKVGAIYVAPGQQDYVACKLDDDGVGKWIKAQPVEAEHGVCSETLKNPSSVYKVDEYEWEKSMTTGKNSFKCDCDYVDVETESGDTVLVNRIYSNCRWSEADDLDIKLNKACNSSTKDSIVVFDGNNYFCEEVWTPTRSYAWNMFDANEDCPNIATPGRNLAWDADYNEPCDYPCVFAGKTYYYSQRTSEWIEFGEGEICKSQREYCQESVSGYAAIDDPVHTKRVVMTYVNHKWEEEGTECIEAWSLCNDLVGGYYNLTYNSELVRREDGYVVMLNGVSMDGFDAPQVYTIFHSDSANYTGCVRETEINNICTVLNGDPAAFEGSSCDNPCKYGGKEYFYNSERRKWMTLDEMGLTDCSDM
ncbi:MAG: hypothetical protein J6U20_10455 [Fibrobacter sp.]|nr:hypothetical protein [Fibrobacter sp.]